MNPLIAILLLMSFSAARSDELLWRDAVALIGIDATSDRFRSVASKYGAVESSDETLNFEAVGITFRLKNHLIHEVVFQVAPGKGIEDVAYRGSLPDKVLQVQSSPEDALNILGEPASDFSGGYRQLTYEFTNGRMTLHYGPQLDYVTFQSKQTEGSGGNGGRPD